MFFSRKFKGDALRRFAFDFGSGGYFRAKTKSSVGSPMFGGGFCFFGENMI